MDRKKDGGVDKQLVGSGAITANCMLTRIVGWQAVECKPPHTHMFFACRLELEFEKQLTGS